MNAHKQLILVKHSLPEIVENIPAREWVLSDEGRSRARMLAEKLKSDHPEIIISSVEAKAKQTAEIISEGLGLQFGIMKGIHEHDRSGVPIHSKDEFQSLVRRFFEQPNTLIFGNETGAQALGRFRKSVQTILESHKGRNLVIVSHGTVMSLFVSWLTRMDGYQLWKKLGLPSFMVLDMLDQQLLKIENIS